MTLNWPFVKLGELLSIKHGWPFEREFFSEDLKGRPIVVTIGNFRYTGGFRFESTTIKEYFGSYPEEYELSPGDILLIMTCQTAGGEILGIPGCIPDDGKLYLHNQRMGKVIIHRPDLVEPNYLYWLFIWEEFNRELVATASGSKILHTAPSRIEAFKFRLPPLPEQRAIAHILGSLDDKIELNRTMNATLEELARSIFKSWFVDFDPVRARAAGRQPVGMDAATAALFPDGFEIVDGREVPRGWEITTLERVAENVRRNINPDEIPVDTPYLGLEHMPRKRIDLDEWGNANDLESNKFAFQRGEVLFGKLRPYFHKVGLAAIDGVCSTDILVLRPKKTIWSGLMLEYVSSSEFVQYTDQSSDGTKMPRTNWTDMALYKIVLPSESIAQIFNNFVTPSVDRIIENVHENRTLAVLRDALLPKLLSGEFRVRDAQRCVEAVSISNALDA